MHPLIRPKSETVSRKLFESLENSPEQFLNLSVQNLLFRHRTSGKPNLPVFLQTVFPELYPNQDPLLEDHIPNGTQCICISS